MIFNILFSLLIFVGVFCIYMLFRNDWVYKNRIRLIDEDYEKYKSLPEYETMLNKFWIWDIEKFKGMK